MAPKRNRQDHKIVCNYSKCVSNVPTVIIDLILIFFTNLDYFYPKRRMVFNKYSSQWINGISKTAYKRPYKLLEYVIRANSHQPHDPFAKAWIGIRFQLQNGQEKLYGCGGYRYNYKNKCRVKKTDKPGKFFNNDGFKSYNWVSGIPITLAVVTKRKQPLIIIKSDHKKITICNKWPISYESFRFIFMMGPQTGCVLQNVSMTQ